MARRGKRVGRNAFNAKDWRACIFPVKPAAEDLWPKPLAGAFRGDKASLEKNRFLFIVSCQWRLEESIRKEKLFMAEKACHPVREPVYERKWVKKLLREEKRSSHLPVRVGGVWQREQKEKEDAEHRSETGEESKCKREKPSAIRVFGLPQKRVSSIHLPC